MALYSVLTIACILPVITAQNRAYSTIVSVNTPSAIPQVDQDIVLKCTETQQGSPPGGAVTWYHNDTLIEASSKYVYESANRMKLRVSSLRKKDSGGYRCQIDNGMEGGVQQEYNLKVRYPPEAPVIRSSRPLVPVDEELTLACHVTDPGYPEPNKYTWFVGNKAITETPNNEYAISWKRVETVNFTCIAENDIGPSPKSASLSVGVEAPVVIESPAVASSPVLFLGDQNQAAEVECTVSGTNIVKLRWYKEGVEVHSGTYYNITQAQVAGQFSNQQKVATRSRLRFLTDSKGCGELAGFQGLYMCNVSGTAGGVAVTDRSPDISVQVNYGPMLYPAHHNLTAGASGEVDCPVCGMPQPDVSKASWKYKESPDASETMLPTGIEPKGGKLVIKDAYMNHSGIYICNVLDRPFAAEVTVLDEGEAGAGSGGGFRFTGLILGIIAAFLFWGLVALYVLWHKKYRKSANDPEKAIEPEEAIAMLEPTPTEVAPAHDTSAEEAEPLTTPEEPHITDDEVNAEEERKKKMKKAERAADKVARWLRGVFLTSLQWMDIITKDNRVFGMKQYKAWYKRKQRNGVIILNGPDEGKLTLINRICLDWAKSKPKSDAWDIKLLLYLPSSKIDTNPVEVLKGLMPGDLLSQSEHDDLMHYFHSCPNKICFIFHSIDLENKNDIQSRWADLFDYYGVRHVTIVPSMKETSEIKSYKEGAEFDNYTMPVFDQDAKEKYMEEALPKNKSKEAVYNLLKAVGHDSSLPYLTEDPDNLCLLCYLYHCYMQNYNPSKHTDIRLPESLTTLLDQIIIQILMYNTSAYKSGVRITEKSVKKIKTKGPIYTFLINEVGPKAFNNARNYKMCDIDYNETKLVKERSPYEPLSGSFKEIDTFMAAFYMVQTDRYKDKHNLLDVSDRMAMYICGLLGHNSLDMLQSILEKDKNNITKLWAECLEEAREHSISKAQLFTSVFEHCIVPMQITNVHIDSDSLRGTKAFLGLVHHKKEDSIWKKVKVTLNMNSLKGFKKSIDKEEEHALHDLENQKKIPLVSALTTIRRIASCSEKVMFKRIRDETLDVSLYDGDIDMVTMNDIFAPAKHIYLKLDSCNLQVEHVKKKYRIPVDVSETTSTLTLHAKLLRPFQGKLKWEQENVKMNKLILSSEGGRCGGEDFLKPLEVHFGDSDHVEYLGLIGIDLFVATKDFKSHLKGTGKKLRLSGLNPLSKKKEIKCGVLGLESNGLQDFDLDIIAILIKKGVKVIILVCPDRDETHLLHTQSIPSPSLVTDPNMEEEQESGASITDICHSAFHSATQDSSVVDIVVHVCRSLPQTMSMFVWCNDDTKHLLKQENLRVDP